MKKYNNRHIRKISKVIKIVYLTSAILWGLSTCAFNSDRDNLKNAYIEGEVSKEEYIDKSKQFSEDEERVFQILAVGFGLAFVGDVVLLVSGVEDE